MTDIALGYTRGTTTCLVFMSQAGLDRLDDYLSHVGIKPIDMRLHTDMPFFCGTVSLEDLTEDELMLMKLALW
jgi:hypothetical protein